jgi:hypothetical protein
MINLHGELLTNLAIRWILFSLYHQNWLEKKSLLILQGLLGNMHMEMNPVTILFTCLIMQNVPGEHKNWLTGRGMSFIPINPTDCPEMKTLAKCLPGIFSMQWDSILFAPAITGTLLENPILKIEISFRKQQNIYGYCQQSLRKKTNMCRQYTLMVRN